MKQVLRGPAAGLELILDDQLDPQVHATCEREFDAMVATLSDWGRYRRPVHLATAADRARLSAASPCPTEGLLRAVAGLESLLILEPSAWGRAPSPLEIEQTLTHELAHVLLFQRCAPPESQREVRLPTWFREGMATVVAEGAPAPGQRRQLADHPALDDLPDADGPLLDQHPGAAYAVATQLFQSWLERFGSRRLSALCRAMRAGHGFEAAHQRACGMVPETWTKAWVVALRQEAATR